MKTELEYFDISPKVVPSGRSSSLRIRPKAGNLGFSYTGEYDIEIIPLDTICVKTVSAKKDGKDLKFSYLFDEEQEYFLRIMRKDDGLCVAKLSVYCLKDDLYTLKPYKGDFHSHTIHSDGKESPEYIAAKYRGKGYDFFAITDHRRYYPSIEAVDFYKDLDCGFLILPGEEIHPPDNHVHMISAGGKYSVYDLIEKNIEEYFKSVNEIMDEGGYSYVQASCIWCAREIKKAGGLSIFCHPFWINRGFNVDEKLSKFFLRNRIFDCFELVGGMERESNNIQISLYNDLRAEGVTIPVVGSSDSHGTVNEPYFNRFKTLVFSKDLSFEDIADAVKNCMSVAVEEYNEGEFIVSGPHRLVKYAWFLLREYFPLHDELCVEEGRIMATRILDGVTAGFESRKVDEFADRCFKEA